MKLSKLRTWALAGAVMCGYAFSGGSAWAACGVAQAQTIDTQDPFTVHLCADVQNDLSTTVTDVDFGQIGATGFVNQSGCLTLAPDGTFDEDNLGCFGSYGAGVAGQIARVVTADDAGSGPAGVGAIDVLGAFPNQEVRMWFQVANTGNDVAPLASPGAPSLYITQLIATTDALGLGNLGTNTQDGEWDILPGDDPESPANLTNLDNSARADPGVPGTGSMYKGITDSGTGNLEINLGATLQTDGTFVYTSVATAASHYAPDNYEGTFEVVLFY